MGQFWCHPVLARLFDCSGNLLSVFGGFLLAIQQTTIPIGWQNVTRNNKGNTYRWTTIPIGSQGGPRNNDGIHISKKYIRIGSQNVISISEEIHINEKALTLFRRIVLEIRGDKRVANHFHWFTVWLTIKRKYMNICLWTVIRNG